MSRNPLIQLLCQAYQSFRVTAATRVPSDVVQAQWQDRLSRRQMLQSMALTGAVGFHRLGRSSLGSVSSTVFGQSGATALDQDARVLVVGAGISGLTVAYRLQQAGVGVDVVEASPRVGGRLRSFSQPSSSLGVVELGGEFIDSRHTTVRSLAMELGLELADLRAADTGLEPEILYFQKQKITHHWVVEAFTPLAQRITQDLAHLSRRDITYHNPSPYAVQLDRLSLAEYLAQTPIHPVLRDLIRVAYVTEYGLDAEAQSCLNMLFLIGAEVGKWSTYGMSDERFHVVGGNDLIPKRLAEKLTGTIETSTALESIRLAADGRYRVSLRQGLTSTERSYERIVLTIPFSVLRQVDLAVEMPPVKQRAIAALGYGTSTKLAIPYREKIWRTQYRSTASIYTDLEFQNTWESARYSIGSGGWMTDLRGGKAGMQLGSNSPDHHATQLNGDLEQIFPGISQVQQGAAMRAVWFTNPYALGSYSCYLPGQYTEFGGAEAERVGNIWFAGEHCSVVSQGYMDGACETAEQAAREILTEMRIKRPLEQFPNVRV